MRIKSVKSINPFKCVIQTLNDIVKAHGGSLTVISLEGKESAFSFTIPALA